MSKRIMEKFKKNWFVIVFAPIPILLVCALIYQEIYGSDAISRAASVKASNERYYAKLNKAKNEGGHNFYMAGVKYFVPYEYAPENVRQSFGFNKLNLKGIFSDEEIERSEDYYTSFNVIFNGYAV